MSTANAIDVPPWERLADLMLQREALHCRMIGGIPARPTTAVYISDDEILDLARELPGLRQAAPEEVGDLDSLFTPALPDAWAAFADWVNVGVHRFAGLCRRANLDDQESSLLALVVATDVDRTRQQVLGYIQDDMSVRHLQLGTLLRLLPDAPAAIVGPLSRLVAGGLVLIDDASTWAETTVKAPTDLVWSVLGVAKSLPEPLTMLEWGDRSDLAKDARGRALVEPLLFVSGGSARERRALAADELVSSAAVLLSEPEDLLQWRAAARAAMTHDVPVVVEIDPKRPRRDWRTVEAHPTVQWVVSSESALSLFDLPNVAFREIRSGSQSPGGAGVDPSWGASGHQLGVSDIEVVKQVLDSGSLEFEAAVKRLASGELDALASRVEVQHGWDDLVLPPRQKERVGEVIDRYRNRRQVHTDWGFNSGRTPGVVAMFSGPSGTGKTLASQIVAAEIGLDLYRVDLSSMVSKYIGESEKNLAKIFDAAETGAVALFFDEADAMFGKRSEVKDSHDRYANISTSYLLQRIEDFDGVVIMATNFSQNIDVAFKRRIDVQVTFALPDAGLRREIWGRAIPGVHHGTVDLDRLAEQFELSGASIHNAVLGGAYGAAAAGVAPATEHYESAVQRELQKLGQFGGFGSVVFSREPVNGVGSNGHA